jgi:hypothetical protein
MTCDKTKPSWPRRLARDRAELTQAVDEILKRTDDQDRRWALLEFVDEWTQKATQGLPRPAIIAQDAPGT